MGTSDLAQFDHTVTESERQVPNGLFDGRYQSQLDPLVRKQMQGEGFREAIAVIRKQVVRLVGEGHESFTQEGCVVNMFCDNLIDGITDYNGNDWLTQSGERSNAWAVLDCGAEKQMLSFKVWNQNEYATNRREVKKLKIQVSNDPQMGWVLGDYNGVRPPHIEQGTKPAPLELRASYSQDWKVLEVHHDEFPWQ